MVGGRVHTSRAACRTIYPSCATSSVSKFGRDASVNLFDSVSEEAGRGGTPPLQSATGSEQWQLVVQDPAGSVDVGVAQWRRRDLVIGFGLLAILAGTVGVPVSSPRGVGPVGQMPGVIRARTIDPFSHPLGGG